MPPNVYVGDRGLLTFNLDHESFTIALDDLKGQGPIWFEDQGVYISPADCHSPFETYISGQRKKRFSNMVKARGDQSFAGAYYGQVRGHSVNFNIGCKHSPQRFRIEPTGDMLLNKRDVTNFGRHPDAEPRHRAKGDVEFFFGLERWITDARFMDPSPVPITNLHLHNGDMCCEQRAVCVPVMKNIQEGELTYHEPTAALVRFRFQNKGNTIQKAVLPLRFSENSDRYHYTYGDNYCSALRKTRIFTALEIAGGRVTSSHNGSGVLRAVYQGDMTPVTDGAESAWNKSLQPGESRGLNSRYRSSIWIHPVEQAALISLNFDQACRDVAAFWRAEIQAKAVLETPVPQLNAVHTSHAAYIEFSDNVLESDVQLITTSVGTSTYANYIKCVSLR